MLLKIHPDNPETRKVQQVVALLEKGGTVIYPTDTVYGLGCDIMNKKAIERICQLRGLNPQKAQLSFMCRDISQVAEYCNHIDNETFRLLKQYLPGPFTFILKANNLVPKMMKGRKDTIGVRVPNNRIVQALIEALGRPILTTSLRADDEILEYFNDPEDIYQDYQKLVDVVIDGGLGGYIPSTVIDCTGDDPVVVREGAGEL